MNFKYKNIKNKGKEEISLYTIYIKFTNTSQHLKCKATIKTQFKKVNFYKLDRTYTHEINNNHTKIYSKTSKVSKTMKNSIPKAKFSQPTIP